MVLPILVLAPVTPEAVHMNLHRQARRDRSGPARQRGSAAGDAQSVRVPSMMGERDKLIQRWRRVSRPPTRPTGSKWRHAPAAPATALPATTSPPFESHELLRECERLMRLLLRRSWARLSHTHRRAIKRAKRGFDLRTATIIVTPEHADSAAWLLAAMHWWGCRHPCVLDQKPLHPPTGIVRWLTGLDLSQQVDRPREVIAMLPGSMALIEHRSRKLVAAMIARRGVVAMLPELLR